MLLSLKKALPRDTDALCALQRQAFQATLDKYRDEQTNPAAERRAEMADRFNTPGVDLYFICADEQAVGYLIIADDGAECRLIRIGILPEHQEKGYGRRAIRLAESAYPNAKTWLLDTIRQEERLCRFYERLGYTRTGLEEHIREGMDLALYVKDVRSAV